MQSLGDSSDLFRAKVRAWLRHQDLPTVDANGLCRCTFRYRGLRKEYTWKRKSDDDDCFDELQNIYLNMFARWQKQSDEKKVVDTLKNRFTGMIKQKSRESASKLKSALEQNMEKLVEMVMLKGSRDLAILSNDCIPMINECVNDRNNREVLQIENNTTAPLLLEYKKNESSSEMFDIFRLDEQFVEKIISGNCTGIELLTKMACREITSDDINSIRLFYGEGFDVKMLESMYLQGSFSGSTIIFSNPPQKAWLVANDFFTLYRLENGKILQDEHAFPDNRFPILINSEVDLYALIASRALCFDRALESFLGSFN